MLTSLNKKANKSIEDPNNIGENLNNNHIAEGSSSSSNLKNNSIISSHKNINIPSLQSEKNIAENYINASINANFTDNNKNQTNPQICRTEKKFFKSTLEDRSLHIQRSCKIVRKKHKSLTVFGEEKRKLNKLNESKNLKKQKLDNLKSEETVNHPFVSREYSLENQENIDKSNLVKLSIPSKEVKVDGNSSVENIKIEEKYWQRLIRKEKKVEPSIQNSNSFAKLELISESFLANFDVNSIESLNSENSPKSKISFLDKNKTTDKKFAKNFLQTIQEATNENINIVEKPKLTFSNIFNIDNFVLETNNNFKQKSNLKRKFEHQYQIDKKKSKNNSNNLTENMSSIYDRPQNGIRSHNNEENNGIINSSSNQYFTSTNPSNIATLSNIGNTCYLNSIVYTLRFAPLFLHKLHHLIDDLANINQNLNKYRMKSSSLGRNVTGLQMENTRSWSSKDLSSLEQNNFYGGNGHNNLNGNNNHNKFSGSGDWQQKSNQQINVIEKLHELYQHLHHNEVLDSSDPYHADTFLQAIQDVSAIFEGNQQQDAHEFLMCVLDNLRETCQSITKSISECPDVISNGCISLPEHNEVTSPTSTNPTTLSSKDHSPQLNNNISNISNISQATSLIKNSLFSRKSKRKEDSKISKNLRLQSPLKDNTQQQPQQSHSTVSKQIIKDLNDGQSKVTNVNCIGAQNGKDNTISKERINEKIKSLGLDFFSEDFEGITVSTTKCLSCETVTEQKETMIDIAVPISQYENVDSTDKTQSFIQNSCITREYFRGENKYRCEQCVGYTEAIRSISYEVLPRLLVIQLSRFSGGMEKINSYLPTPFTLQCFCSKCAAENENDKLHVYKLYSVITHVGATMSVGHYIAYTCALDWSEDEYLNCPKDRRRHQAKLNLSLANNVNANANNNETLNTNREEKQNGLIKKIFYGRNKASSSGDMSKSVKNINSNINNSASANNSSKSIVNGVDKLKIINPTCPSLNCCGTKLKSQQNNVTQNNYNGSSNVINSNGSSYIELNDEYGNNPLMNKIQNSNLNEPIWYMCDDDKIKAMTQREFEELLSPNRKIMITPYLLFYARKTLNGNKGNNSD